MVGANVNALEEQVTQVEGEVGTLPGAFKKIFRTMAVPGFLNVSFFYYIHACRGIWHSLKIAELVPNVCFVFFFLLQKPASPRRQSQRHQEFPSVFRTEDYFKPQSEQ